MDNLKKLSMNLDFATNTIAEAIGNDFEGLVDCIDGRNGETLFFFLTESAKRFINRIGRMARRDTKTLEIMIEEAANGKRPKTDIYHELEKFTI